MLPLSCSTSAALRAEQCTASWPQDVSHTRHETGRRRGQGESRMYHNTLRYPMLMLQDTCYSTHAESRIMNDGFTRSLFGHLQTQTQRQDRSTQPNPTQPISIQLSSAQLDPWTQVQQRDQKYSRTRSSTLYVCPCLEQQVQGDGLTHVLLLHSASNVSNLTHHININMNMNTNILKTEKAGTRRQAPAQARHQPGPQPRQPIDEVGGCRRV